MILRARIVWPGDAPPIEDGAVCVHADRIAAVGSYPEVTGQWPGPVVDLGERVLLPGLINAHCHLDYTDFAGLIPPPREFPDWIQSILALKAQWQLQDYERSWRHGAEMLLRGGLTTVADIEAVPELLPRMASASPLRVISFRELIGLKPGAPAQALVDQAVRECEPFDADRVGLAPHAPYSTTLELLRWATDAARQRGWRLTIHVAESEAEFRMFRDRSGPLLDWLKPRRNLDDCGTGSPVQHLARGGCLGADLLAAHVNYLAEGDAALLARHGVSVVHCPRSHDYFGHAAFPRSQLADAGVNLCLGTDSLASVGGAAGQTAALDLFAEMRLLAARQPALAPAEILHMATVHAAKALGLENRLGRLAPGLEADLIAVPYAGSTSDVAAAVIHHTGPVTASMIRGRWAVGFGVVPGMGPGA